MSCSTLCERAAGSPPNTSQVSLHKWLRGALAGVWLSCAVRFRHRWLADTVLEPDCVTPEGVRRPAKCTARATHAGTCASSRRHHPEQQHVTSNSPVGDISVATLVRTDTTLDHRQKVKKVCRCRCIRCCVAPIGLQGALLHASARRQVCLRRAVSAHRGARCAPCGGHLAHALACASPVCSNLQSPAPWADGLSIRPRCRSGDQPPRSGERTKEPQHPTVSPAAADARPLCERASPGCASELGLLERAC